MSWRKQYKAAMQRGRLNKLGVNLSPEQLGLRTYQQAQLRQQPATGLFGARCGGIFGQQPMSAFAAQELARQQRPLDFARRQAEHMAQTMRHKEYSRLGGLNLGPRGLHLGPGGFFGGFHKVTSQ